MDALVLDLLCVATVVILLLSVIVVQAIGSARERREHRAQVERLERLLASRNLGEFAATEAVLARPPEKVTHGEPKARLYDDVWRGPRSES